MLTSLDTLSFQILSLHRICNPAGFYSLKSRPYGVFSYRLNGTATFNIQGKIYSCGRGDVLYLPAETACEVEYSPNEVLAVHLSECNCTEPHVLRTENPSAIELQFLRMWDAWREGCSVHRVKAHIYEILDILCAEKSSRKDTVAFRCVTYLKEHFRDPELRMERLCSDLYLSTSTLRWVFAKEMGVSPKQYLTQLRLNHALSLLTDKKLSIKEIAYECGFSDEKYFSSVFKKTYGRSPSLLKNDFMA